MLTRRNIDPEIIFYFAWRDVLLATILSSGVVVLYDMFKLHNLSIPFLPIATVGTAVAFYVGFKNNSSYDRLWEARKIWGEITNISRAMCAYLVAVVRTDEGKQAAKLFIYRQICFINMLRLQLRKRNMWDESHPYTRLARKCFAPRPYEEEAPETLRTYLPEEDVEKLLCKNNVACELLSMHLKELSRFKAQGWIDDFESSDMSRMCADLYAQQGKAERIKQTPFPRQYAYFSEVFVFIFVCLLPFGLIGEFVKISPSHAWLTVPFAVLISWVFYTMEKVGDTSENPFEGSINDVPLTAICRSIEINLKEMLCECNIPEPMQVDEGILM